MTKISSAEQKASNLLGHWQIRFLYLPYNPTLLEVHRGTCLCLCTICSQNWSMAVRGGVIWGQPSTVFSCLPPVGSCMCPRITT